MKLKRTKADESRQTIALALSPPKAAAVELLALGKTDTDAAEAVGVTRQTVNGWRHNDPAFVAEVNRRRSELWDEAHNRLRAMVTRALEVIEKALEGRLITALPAAVHVLRAVKVYGEVGAPAGPTTPEAVLARQAEAEARQRLGEEIGKCDALALLMMEEQVPALAREIFNQRKAAWLLGEGKP